MDGNEKLDEEEEDSDSNAIASSSAHDDGQLFEQSIDKTFQNDDVNDNNNSDEIQSKPFVTADESIKEVNSNNEIERISKYNQLPSQKQQHGYRGVYWSEDRKLWRARIKINGVREHLGYFPTVESAARAYDKRAAEAQRPNFLYNFPEEQFKAINNENFDKTKDSQENSDNLALNVGASSTQLPVSIAAASHVTILDSPSAFVVAQKEHQSVPSHKHKDSMYLPVATPMVQGNPTNGATTILLPTPNTLPTQQFERNLMLPSQYFFGDHMESEKQPKSPFHQLHDSDTGKGNSTYLASSASSSSQNSASTEQSISATLSHAQSRAPLSVFKIANRNPTPSIVVTSSSLPSPTRASATSSSVSSLPSPPSFSWQMPLSIGQLIPSPLRQQNSLLWQQQQQQQQHHVLLFQQQQQQQQFQLSFLNPSLGMSASSLFGNIQLQQQQQQPIFGHGAVLDSRSHLKRNHSDSSLPFFQPSDVGSMSDKSSTMDASTPSIASPLFLHGGIGSPQSIMLSTSHQVVPETVDDSNNKSDGKNTKKKKRKTERE